MVLESGNKDIETKPDEGFFAYLREIRNNLKKFVSDIFSTKKEVSSQLDGLKRDVSDTVDEKKVLEQLKLVIGMIELKVLIKKLIQLRRIQSD